MEFLSLSFILHTENLKNQGVIVRYQQVAFGDLILLNKIDLVDKDELVKLRNRLRKINPFAKMIPTVPYKMISPS